MPSHSKDKLIVALDVDSADQARELFSALRESVGMFKIGMQLFTAAGPSLVREIIGAGGQIFLDLKYHDIPNTVAAAGVEAARLGVSIFNIHSMGGSEMMRRTAEAVTTVSEREGLARPKVIAVTLLTSADAGVLDEVAVGRSPAQQVVAMAQLAANNGMDGVVASPLEVSAIRSAVAPADFLIVTPGVRPEGSAVHDQRRILTPRGAINAGADYIVVGRPIIEAPNPTEAAREILREIDENQQFQEPSAVEK